MHWFHLLDYLREFFRGKYFISGSPPRVGYFSSFDGDISFLLDLIRDVGSYIYLEMQKYLISFIYILFEDYIYIFLLISRNEDFEMN